MLRTHRGDQADRPVRGTSPGALADPPRRPAASCGEASLLVDEERRVDARRPSSRSTVAGVQHAPVRNEPGSRADRRCTAGPTTPTSSLSRWLRHVRVRRPAGSAGFDVPAGAGLQASKKPATGRRRSTEIEAGSSPTGSRTPRRCRTRRPARGNLGDELAVVAGEGHGQPDVRKRPVRRPGCRLVAGQPLRMSRGRVGVDGVRVDPRHHAHPRSTRALDQLPEEVGVAEMATAVVVRDFRRVEGDVAAGAQAQARSTWLRHHPTPEVAVEVERVVLHECQLGPTAGLAIPPRHRRRRPWLDVQHAELRSCLLTAATESGRG